MAICRRPSARQAGTIEGLSLGNTIVARKNITLGPSQIRYRKKRDRLLRGILTVPWARDAARP